MPLHHLVQSFLCLVQIVVGLPDEIGFSLENNHSPEILYHEIFDKKESVHFRTCLIVCSFDHLPILL